MLQPCLRDVQGSQDMKQTEFDPTWQSIIHVRFLEGQGNGKLKDSAGVC